MPTPHGFTYERRPGGTSPLEELGGGSVVVTHHGRRAVILRGARAVRFLAEVEADDPQRVMARWTGNYKRGNERTAKAHPRNRR
ncbi:hypothetical protein [Streptomyces boncukensis]|uniref:Uncharacterized protein n=1 Tax=Streptomyces boncukensis TaxID=2711219 RepID=A0A6G4WQR8_9ACTN|nr:hypothetical protein [Streptomyces boncukensis]NGO67363.1 hypothetical protein [Streptomyces boncukensis]